MSKNISYYQDEKKNLWKKEDGDEFFFSRKELKWIKSQIVFILPEWEYRFKIEEGEAHMILDDYKKEGSLNTEKIPFRYFANDNDMVFAEDILGNEFYVLNDMSLRSAPKGTIDPYWGGVDELEAKELVLGVLFRINHGYTLMDEDYSYDLIVFADGSIHVYQMESESYEKQSTIVEKGKSEKLKSSISEIINKYKSDIDKLEFKGEINRGYSGSLGGKYFSITSLEAAPFMKEISIAIKKLIEEVYPGEIKWDISISAYGYDIK